MTCWRAGRDLLAVRAMGLWLQTVAEQEVTKWRKLSYKINLFLNVINNIVEVTMTTTLAESILACASNDLYLDHSLNEWRSLE